MCVSACPAAPAKNRVCVSCRRRSARDARGERTVDERRTPAVPHTQATVRARLVSRRRFYLTTTAIGLSADVRHQPHPHDGTGVAAPTDHPLRGRKGALMSYHRT
ncbi:MAG: hypothetical protein M3Y74_04355, partial [Chloroflexota bacterium]|nr:hypothetical protein [Chloroflexota bacterium]